MNEQNYYTVVVWGKNSHVPTGAYRLNTELGAREFFYSRMDTGNFRKLIIEHRGDIVMTSGA